MVFLSPLIAIGATALLALIMFAAVGHDPVQALVTFITVPFADLYSIGEIFIKAAPLVLIGVGLAVGFRAGIEHWRGGPTHGRRHRGRCSRSRIRADGQQPRTAGDDSRRRARRACVGEHPSVLRTRFNANEILVSLMLNYVAALWLSYLIFGPWRDPAGYNFPQSEPLAQVALFPIILDNTRLNASVFIALAAVVLGWLLMSRSFVGFQLQVAGLAENAARYAGFKSRRMVWIGMLAGGLAAGLAGVGEIAGPLGQIFPTASPGYGYTAIIVAFLGRLNPIGILLAGLLMSLLYLSGDAAQMLLGMPSSITALFQGTLFFLLLSADVLIYYRIRYVPSLRAAREVST